jgi:hypothetical protein
MQPTISISQHGAVRHGNPVCATDPQAASAVKGKAGANHANRQ